MEYGRGVYIFVVIALCLFVLSVVMERLCLSVCVSVGLRIVILAIDT